MLVVQLGQTLDVHPIPGALLRVAELTYASERLCSPNRKRGPAPGMGTDPRDDGQSADVPRT